MVDVQLRSAPDRDGAAGVLARRLAMVDGLTTAIGESLELPELLARTLKAVIEATGGDGGGIFLLDERSGELELAAHHGLSPRLVAALSHQPGKALEAIVRDPQAPVTTREVAALNRRREVVAEGLQFYAAIPLQARGRALGVLVGASRTLPGLEHSVQDLLLGIGRHIGLATGRAQLFVGKQIGMAIERAQLFERERRRARVMETISEVGRRIVAIRTERELLASIVNLVRERLGYEGAALLLIDPSGRELVIEVDSGIHTNSSGFRLPVDAECGVTAWVAANAQPLLVNDVTKESRYLHVGAHPPGGSELGVPIEASGRVLGVLDVQSPHVNAFDAIDLSALQTLAGQIAVAIENVRLHEEHHQTLQRRHAFQQVTASITASLDLSTTLDRALDAAMGVFGVDRAAIMLYRPQDKQMLPAASRNLSEAFLTAIHDFYEQMPQPSSFARLKRDRHIYVEDVQRTPPIPALAEAIRREGFRSMLIVPLRNGDNLHGVFALFHDRIRHYSAEDVALVQNLADQAAVALEHARLYQDSEQALQRTRAFQAVSTAITGSLDLPTTLEHALSAAMEVFGADRAAIFLDHPTTKYTYCAASRNLSTPYLDAVESHYRNAPPPVTQRIDTERSIYIENAQINALAPPLADAARREGFRSMLFLPLYDNDERFGVFVLYHDQIRHYDDDEIALGQTFAHQARIAIVHARLFERERRARQQAATILDATRAVASSLQLNDVLREAASCIAAALHQHHCGVWLLDETGTLLRPVVAVADPPDPELAQKFLNVPPLVVEEIPELRAVLREGKANLEENPADACELPQYGDGANPFQAYLSVPLVIRDQALGMVSVAVIERGVQFDPADIEVALAIARSAALAVENARLYEQAQRLAVSEERNRLARELHDSVTQSLFSMTLICQALPRILDRDPQRARERLDRLNELGRGALAEMRALIFELRPAALEDEGLVMALRKHVDAFQSRETIAVEFEVAGDRRLPSAVEEGIFRVAQEALNNVAKHAAAARVVVRLTLTETLAELTVSDNGRGFESEAPRVGRRTLGLTSMQERASLLDGRYTMSSTLGEGTTVNLSVPLDAAKAGA